MADKHKNPGSRTLYHYTSKEGAQGIADSGVIRQSTNTRTDAVAGKGVYLTSMQPDQHSKSRIATNNYDGVNKTVAERAMQAGKVDYVVEVEVPSKDVQKVNARGRDVYLHKGDINLH